MRMMSSRLALACAMVFLACGGVQAQQAKLSGKDRADFVKASVEACMKGQAESGSTPASYQAYCNCTAQRTVGRFTRAQLTADISPIKPQMDEIKNTCMKQLKKPK